MHHRKEKEKNLWESAVAQLAWNRLLMKVDTVTGKGLQQHRQPPPANSPPPDSNDSKISAFFPTWHLPHHREQVLWGQRPQKNYNGYNGGWPSASLFGWSAADWSQPATNEEKRKKILLRKEIMNKLVVDLLQQKGLGCWKVLKKRCKQKGKMLPQLTNSMVLVK